MGKVFVVISGKGGTGKTTTSAAVSSCLAALGHRVLCVDFDAGLKNLDISLGMSDFAVLDFVDVMRGRAELMDACTEHTQIDNLFFLSAPSFCNHDGIDRDAIERFYDICREEFEFIFIDCPAGIGTGFRLAVASADAAIVVTTGDGASMRDAGQAAQNARDFGIDDVRLVVNRIRPRHLRRVRTTVDDVIDTVGARLLGLVMEDQSVYLSADTGVPLVLYSRKRAAMQYLKIARRLRGERIRLAWY